MTSLATCIKKAGKALNKRDADAIREIMADGLSAEDAIDEYLNVRLPAERAELEAEIEAAGGALYSMAAPSIEETRALAEQYHAGQLDYEGQPYNLHVESVAQSGRNDDEKLVGYLHDIVEDTGATADTLSDRYPPYIVEAVEALTWQEEAGEAYEDYMARVLANPLATAVKFFDTRDNMRLSGINRETGEPVPNSAFMERRTYDAMVKAWKAMEGDKPPLPGPEILRQIGGSLWDKYWVGVWNNLTAVSRTLGGVTDAAGSAQKADAFATTGADAAARAKINLQDAWRYAEQHKKMGGPDELLKFMTDLSVMINKGIVKEGQVFREHEGKPGRYLPVYQIQHQLRKFANDLYNMLETAQPVELAAFIHRRFNHEIHPYVDGVGKTTEILTDWALARRGDPLPVLPDFKEFYAAVSETKGDLAAFTEFMRGRMSSRLQAGNNTREFRAWVARLPEDLRTGYEQLLADKTHINDQKIELMLLPTDSAMDIEHIEHQLRFAGWVLNTDNEVITDLYNNIKGEPEDADGGIALNVDAFRELDEAYRKNRSRFAKSTHEASSAWVKDRARIIAYLNAPQGKENLVLILAGGSGAGKGSARKANGHGRAKLVIDAVMGQPGSAFNKIDQALDSGNEIAYQFVYRDITESWINGVIPRALEHGRTVSLDAHIRNHLGALATAESVSRRYAARPGFHFRLWYNRTNFEDGGPVDSLDDLPAPKDSDTLLAEGLNLLQEVILDGGTVDYNGKWFPITEEHIRGLVPAGEISGEGVDREFWGQYAKIKSAPEEYRTPEEPQGPGRAETPAEYREEPAPEVRPLYSRADGTAAVRQAELQLALAPAIRSLVGVARVNVTQSTAELPPATDPETGETVLVPTDVEGMWQSPDGRDVWLVADNLPSVERAKKVFAHEAFGHMAMEQQPEFQDVLASVKNLLALNNKTFVDVAEKVALTQGNLDENRQAKEILAYMAENGIENGTIARAMAAVRSMLRRMGLLDGANYSEAEIKELLVRAAKDVVGRADAKQAALAAMPVQEQILNDPNAVADAVYTAINEVYANNVLMDQMGTAYAELDAISGSEDPSLQARADAIRNRLGRHALAPGIAPDMLDPEALYSVAYHGTAALFNQFDMNYMGSGEGWQAYGWGMYFSTKRAVAEWYKRKVSRNRIKYDYGENVGLSGDEVQYQMENNLIDELLRLEFDMEVAGRVGIEVAAAALSMYRRHNGSLAAVKEELARQSKNYAKSAEIGRRTRDADTGDINWGRLGPEGVIARDAATAEAYDRATELVNRLSGMAEAGNIMEVEVPEDEDLLDYDGLMSDQPDILNKIPQEVQDGIMDAHPNLTKPIADMRGGQFYGYLGSYLMDRESQPYQGDLSKVPGDRDRMASLYLKEQGIPGHRYVGQSSDELNYLMYDDAAIEIQKINDQPVENLFSRRASQYLQIDDKLRNQPPQLAAETAMPDDLDPGMFWALASEAGTRAFAEPRGSWEERYYTEIGRRASQAARAAIPPPAQITEQQALFSRAPATTNRPAENIDQLVSELGRSIQSDLGLDELELRFNDNGAIAVDLIQVPIDQRGQGVGTQAMRRIVSFADEQGVPVELYVGQMRPGEPNPELVSFYESVGFKRTEQEAGDMRHQLFSRSLMKVRPVWEDGVLTRTVDVLKNPSAQELIAFSSAVEAEHDEYRPRYDVWNEQRAGLRWMVDREDNYYFWDASDEIHMPIARALGNTKTIQREDGRSFEIPRGAVARGYSEDIISKEDIQAGYLRGYEAPGLDQLQRTHARTGRRISPRPLYSRYIHPDPEIERVRDKVLVPAIEDMTTKDRVRDLVNRVRGIDWLSVKQGMVDSAASIANLERGIFNRLLDAKESPYKAVLATRNLGSVMAAIMHRGIPIYQNGVFMPRSGRKGLIEIFEKITHHEKGNLLPLWELYAAAVRANRLIKEKNRDGTSREKNFNQADINKALTLGVEFPEFEVAMREWQKFNSQLLDLAIKRGVINGEEAKLWRRNDYVPFYRAMEEVEYEGGQGPQTRGAGGIADVRSGIKRLSGSESKIGNVFENMVMNTAYLTDAIYRNTAMQRVALMADGIAMHKIPMAFEAIRFSDADLARALMKAGLIVGNGINEADMFNDGIRQVGAMTKEQKEHWSTLFRRVAPQGPNVVSVLEQGKPVYYEVDDPLLLRSITAMGAQQWGGIMHTFRFAKRTLTKAVTIDPAFMMANFLRDTLSTAVVMKGAGAKQLTGAMQGLKAAWTEDKDILEMMMAGAGGGGFYDHNPADVRKMLAKKMPAGKVDSFMNSVITPRGAWRFWQKVGNASEQANRVAVYKRIIAEGGSPAEAAYQARDVLNFTMTGDYAAMKFLVQTVPFLNARIQGLYRLGRGAAENPIGFAMKGLSITAATMALLLKNIDDERYKELPEWDKDVYWHFFIGDEHFRLPKPFEVGALFATTAERAYMLGTGDDDLDITVNRAWRMMLDTFAFNPIPQAIKPIQEQYSNRNMFTGNPIIGMAHKGLQPEAQYDPWTSETMRELAKILPGWGGSPKRLEHFVRAYFGAIGMYALGASDAVTRRAFGHPDRPTKGIRNYPVLTRFWRDPNPRTSKYSAQLYDMLGEADSIYKTMNAYRKQKRVAEAAAMLKEGRGKLAARAYLHDVAKDVRKINNRIRQVQFSNMDPDKKKAAIDKLNAAKIKTMARVARVSDIF
jgi:hypothetical protein